jgi:hypothetical protein
LNSSQLDADLIRAYREAVYRIDEAFELRIDRYSAELEAWQHHRGVESSALITAFNPAGRRCSPDFNQQAHRHLKRLILESGRPHCPTVALDPRNDWPPEAGFLIGGLGAVEADALAQAFDQNAWVWAQCDAVPRLRLMR